MFKTLEHTTAVNHKLLICPIYAPPKIHQERSQFFTSLREHLISVLEPGEELVLLGDFNCVESQELDRLNPSRIDPSIFGLTKLTSDLGLFDAFRYVFPEKREYSFVSNLGNASRLDRTYVSNSLLASVVNVDHPPNPFLDHTFLQMDLDFRRAVQGKNSWNLPSALLEDETYLGRIRAFWTGWKTCKHKFDSILEWWDVGKSKIQTLTQTYTYKTSRASRKHEESIEKRLRNAIAGGKMGLIRHLSSLLRDIKAKRAKTHFAYRRLKWVEEGEKCTAFFLQTHQQQSQASAVNRIRTPEGISTDSGDILKEFRNFYSELYLNSPTSTEAQDTVLSFLTRKLSQEQSEECIRPFVLGDLRQALQQSDNGKCPGLDGIPVEFYKTIWQEIGQDLL